MAKADAASDASLKRLGGGRWQTRDERFTIEPQSGTWVVVDAEQTDELGLPLVRGPFPSLTAAREAIASARESEPATSPLAERLARGGDDTRTGRAAASKPTRSGASAGRGQDEGHHGAEEPAPSGEAASRTVKPGAAGARSAGSAGRSRAVARAEEGPREPAWIGELAASERGRARRLIAWLAEAGVSDAEGIVRRDLVGGVPAVAGVAIARRLEALGPDADPAAVVDALAEGRDEDLGVRWRIVDGDGRPIGVEPLGRRRRR
jgi:hypothetical protein